MRKSGILVALVAAVIAGCGGGGAEDDAFQPAPAPTSPGGGGGAGTVTATQLTISSAVSSIPADGSATVEIFALARNASNVVTAGVPVTFQASSGSISAGILPTDSDGRAAVVLTTGGDSTPRNITVTARAGALTATTTVVVGAAASSNNISALTIVSDIATIPTDGSAGATIAAIARDASNILVRGVPVSFTASSGGLAITEGVTDVNGQAVARLSTAGDPAPRAITVTATAGGRTATTTVNVAPTSATTTVSIGNGSGPAFLPSLLGIAVPNLSAGASTSVTVSIVRSDNTLFTGPVTLNFNSPCVAAGTALIQPQASVTTTTGQATITYVARGCSGSDTITATATVGNQSLSANGTVTVAAATIGSIVFVSATPTNIALRGTGETGRPETSTLIFRVQDSSGGPVSAALVRFSLSTTVGAINLTSTEATSDSQGNVQAIVNAGTVATPVTVSANVVNSVIGTQSTQLTISTGIPTAASFSLAVSCFNVEGLDFDGTTATVTARLADRFSNPAPNGTAVSFTAEGGSILPQCQTETNQTEGGVCSVEWRSSNPRPPDGRASLLATAIGEESFVDVDGNGAFTPPDTFRLTASGGNPAQDLGEPWLDLNENGLYDFGEPFFDFYNEGAQAGVRDGPDGKFNGALCQDAARCPDLTVNPRSRSAGIGAGNLIILSGSTPSVDVISGPINLTTNSARTVSFWVRDRNGNPMPGTTSVAVSVTGGGLSLGAPTSLRVPCATPPANTQVPGVTVFTYTLSAGTTPGTGSLTLTVTTPRNLVTVFQYPVTVTP